ncbi:MAG: AMMECR1 domain-containing protein [Victivallales bacterium]|nr:AMMECR1 domain-containing protein [Victivallales bacterium]
MERKACKILGAMMMAILFLCGCADDVALRPEPYKPPIGGEETLLGKLEECLGAVAQREPGRDLKGALVACGNGQGAMEDWGLSIGRLQNNVRTVYVVWADDAVPKGRAAIPNGESWECPVGTVKFHKTGIDKLLQGGAIFFRGELNERQREQLTLMASLLAVRFGDVEIVPLFAALDVDGQILASRLARLLSEPATALVGVLPHGFAESHPDWRQQVHARRDGGNASAALPNVCDMMCLMADGYALNVFDLQYNPRPAPRRPAKSAPPPERRRIESLAFLETVDSSALMELVRQSEWSDEAILKELSFRRKQVSGSYLGSFLNREEELVLLDFVRKVMLCRLAKTDPPEMPQYSRTLLGNYGCSIALHRDGKTLGAVSQMAGNQALPVVLTVNATKLTADEKHPITVEDVVKGRLEIGVITPATKLSYQSLPELYGQLKPGVHGVILRAGGKSAGFVPVVWKTVQTPQAFMAALCKRCGQTEVALMAEGTEVSVFEVHTFTDDVNN